MISIISLSLLTGISKAVSDKIRHHYSVSIFILLSGFWKEFSSDSSWKRKYNNNKYITFLLSTILVWVTDLWHLCNTIQMFGFMLSIYYIPKNIIYILLFWILNRIFFHIVYTYILDLRFWNKIKFIIKT